MVAGEGLDPGPVAEPVQREGRLSDGPIRRVPAAERRGAQGDAVAAPLDLYLIR